MAKRTKTTLADAPTRPVAEKARRYLTLAEWKRLRKAAGVSSLRDEAVVLLIYEAGLRRAEVGRVRLSYLDKLRYRKIYVWRGKDSRSTYVELSATTAKVIRRWAKKRVAAGAELSDPLFPGYRGAGIGGRAVYNLVSDLGATAAIPEHLRFPHALKHSRVQHLLEGATARGADPRMLERVLADFVGHRQARTTIDHYMQRTSHERRLAKELTDEYVR